MIHVSDKQAQLAGNILREASLNVLIVQGLGVTVLPALPTHCCHRDGQPGDVEVHSSAPTRGLVPGHNTNASSQTNHQIIRLSNNMLMARGAGLQPFVMHKQLLIFSVVEEGES